MGQRAAARASSADVAMANTTARMFGAGSVVGRFFPLGGFTGQGSGAKRLATHLGEIRRPNGAAKRLATVAGGAANRFAAPPPTWTRILVVSGSVVGLRVEWMTGASGLLSDTQDVQVVPNVVCLYRAVSAAQRASFHLAFTRVHAHSTGFVYTHTQPTPGSSADRSGGRSGPRSSCTSRTCGRSSRGQSTRCPRSPRQRPSSPRLTP